MSKAAKILNEIVGNKEISSSVLDDKGNPGVIFDIAAAARIIEKHLRDVHNEAVDATVMAMNRKQFIRPEYKL